MDAFAGDRDAVGASEIDLHPLPRPTREQALSMLARALAEPAAMFARAVKAVADQQGGGEVAAEAPAEAEPA